MTRGHRPRLRRVRPCSSRPRGADARIGAVLVRQRQASWLIDYYAVNTTPATPERKQRPSLDPARFPNGAITDRSGLVQVLGADVRKGAKTPYHWWRADATSPQGQSHAQAFLEATQTGSDTLTDALPRSACHAHAVGSRPDAGNGSDTTSLVRRRTPSNTACTCRPSPLPVRTGTAITATATAGNAKPLGG